MNVTVIGTGYVGLVTGCCLAYAGNQVVCIDNNRQKIDDLKNGKVPIFEPGLKEILQRTQQQNRISFTSDLSEGVAAADVIFLALPTPPQEDGSADLTVILNVADQLSTVLPNKYCVIIDKSTVPVGTAEKVQDRIAKKAANNFDVASNPEFLREGHAIEDFNRPERVVVGVNSKRAETVLRKLYKPFTNEERPLLVTDPRTAELVKYAANTFLVTKINYMNEMAQLCELMNADVDMLRLAIGADSRIGNKFLNPGIGCGGSCFPKDVRALNQMALDYNYDFKLLSAAMAINDQQQNIFVDKITDHFDDNVKGKTFAVWGLAFKPNTDDIREAPALVIIDKLIAAGSKIKAYDPEAGENAKARYRKLQKVEILDDKFKVLDGAEALIIATEWPEFVKTDVKAIAKQLKQPTVFDGRNIFKAEIMKSAGFNYYSVGRRPILVK
ncbi:MAG TPA: UDP-glucose/GDP-mannose dehydrogenase family protein [Candidatus Saccharimonadales bacterium]|nr:UDP-glucose/GDP-mannose dehydrogenase family protein [Candidatus Saccharimonadales bacterium]